jgi:muramoyltetrapeptide carboxypeptidase LdcA involved in peptidoglycan recycling
MERETTIYEILTSYLPKHIPVAFNGPFGHQMPNYPLVAGTEYYLSVQPDEVILQPSPNFYFS